MPGLFGPSSGQKKALGGLENLAGYGTSQGQSDVSDVSSFFRSLLSGNLQDAMKVLAPQIQTIQNQRQQQENQLAQFGNRSGGNNAAIQGSNDAATAQINNLIANLTGQAANNLGSLGTNLLNLGLGANTSAGNLATEIAKQQQSGWASLGNAVGGIVAPGLSDKFSSLLNG